MTDRAVLFTPSSFFFLAKLVIDQLVYDVALSLILE